MKIFETIKKHDNIFMLFVVFFSVMGLALNLNLTNSDELWNFQSIYKMYNGYIIYKDINVLVTPLFFYLGNLLFNLFGGNFFVFRIYAIFINTALVFSTYILLKKLGIRKIYSIIITIFIILINETNILITGANYNILVLVFVLIGIINILNQPTNKTFIIQGILVFLIFMTKQNIGVFYILSLIVYYVCCKKEIKKSIKIGITFILCLTVYLIYLLATENLYNFINYAFLGISEFASGNISISKIEIFALIFLEVINLVISIILLKNKKTKINKEEEENIKILLIFSSFLLLMTYPIFNILHIAISTYISKILLIYLLINFLLKDFKIKEKILKIIAIILIVISVSYSLFYFKKWVKYQLKGLYSYNEPYFGASVKLSQKEEIEEVDQYILTNPRQVIIIASSAAMYNMPLKINNGIFDLPFKGNLGIEKERALIKKIEQIDEETEILLDKEENCYQESEKTKQFIKDNLEYIGMFKKFDIYLKK